MTYILSSIGGRNGGRTPSPNPPSEKDDPSPKPPSEIDVDTKNIKSEKRELFVSQNLEIVKMAKKVKIRQATIEDLPEIIRVEKEAWPEGIEASDAMFRSSVQSCMKIRHV